MKVLKILGLFLFCARAQYDQRPEGQNFPSTNTLYTTPRLVFTDIPDSVAQEALFVDFGNYEYTKFHYTNNQQKDNQNKQPILRFPSDCIPEYQKCLISQSVPTPICAYNKPNTDSMEGFQGYLTAYSDCDIYFDNCRIGYRVWRILDLGRCNFGYGIYKDDVQHTRRLIAQNNFIAKVIDAMYIKTGLIENRGNNMDDIENERMKRKL